MFPDRDLSVRIVGFKTSRFVGLPKTIQAEIFRVSPTPHHRGKTQRQRVRIPEGNVRSPCHALQKINPLNLGASTGNVPDDELRGLAFSSTHNPNIVEDRFGVPSIV